MTEGACLHGLIILCGVVVGMTWGGLSGGFWGGAKGTLAGFVGGHLLGVAVGLILDSVFWWHYSRDLRRRERLKAQDLGGAKGRDADKT